VCSLVALGEVASHDLRLKGPVNFRIDSETNGDKYQYIYLAPRKQNGRETWTEQKKQ